MLVAAAASQQSGYSSRALAETVKLTQTGKWSVSPAVAVQKCSSGSSTMEDLGNSRPWPHRRERSQLELGMNMPARGSGFHASTHIGGGGVLIF